MLKSVKRGRGCLRSLGLVFRGMRSLKRYKRKLFLKFHYLILLIVVSLQREESIVKNKLVVIIGYYVK